MLTTDPLISYLDESSSALGLAPSTICLRAINDGKFYDRVLSGGSYLSRTERKIREWISNHAADRERLSA